jgi:hypothetical protein
MLNMESRYSPHWQPDYLPIYHTQYMYNMHVEDRVKEIKEEVHLLEQLNKEGLDAAILEAEDAFQVDSGNENGDVKGGRTRSARPSFGIQFVCLPGTMKPPDSTAIRPLWAGPQVVGATMIGLSSCLVQLQPHTRSQHSPRANSVALQAMH